MIIPDLNVLLYAADGASSRHSEAKAWLEGAVNMGGEEIGVPWVVHLGFLRLTTSPKIFPRPLQIEEACAWMDNLLEHPAVIPVNPGKAHAGLLRHLLLAAGSGGNLVTDANIAALALEHDAVLATGDRDFLRFPGLRTRMLF